MLASNVVTEIWLNLTATRVLLRHLPYFFFSRVKIIKNLSSFKWVTVKSVHIWNIYIICKSRSSHSEVFLGKGVLKLWRKITGVHQCRMQNNFIEITLWHACSLVNLLHIFRTPFLKNTPGWLLLKFKHPFEWVTVNNWQYASVCGEGERTHLILTCSKLTIMSFWCSYC